MLRCINTKDYRPLNPTLPSVHFCRAKGIRHLNGHYQLELPVKDEKPPKQEKLQHELAITQFAVALSESMQGRDDLSVTAWEQRYGHRGKALVFKNPEETQLQPDASFVLRQQRGDPTPHALLHFIEVDMGNMTPGQVYHKLRSRYADWYESSEGQQFLAALYNRFGRNSTTLIFRLLVVAHADERYASAESRLTHLYLEALKLPDYVRDTLWFTTDDEISSPGALTQSIWRRGRDAASWLSDFHTYSATLAGSSGPGRKPLIARREYVARQFATTAKVCLLPPLPHTRQTKSS